ncbi:hypothetical protein BH20BAC1_BH20BAC1_23300 [soil metagenome]
MNYPGVIVKKEDLERLPNGIRDAVLRNKNSYNIDSIRNHFRRSLALAKKNNLPLDCGEWGCLNTFPDEARLRWFKDMVTVLKKIISGGQPGIIKVLLE